MNNLYEKATNLGFYNEYLEITQLWMEVYSKLKDKTYYEYAMETLKIAKNYKTKLKLL